MRLQFLLHGLSMVQPDRQCTYNVTKRRVHEIITVVEMQLVLHISVCVLASACVYVGARTLACTCACVALLTQHATRRRIVICGPSGSTTFWKLTHKRHDIQGKKSYGTKTCNLFFSTNFVSNISDSKKTSAR